MSNKTQTGIKNQYSAYQEILGNKPHKSAFDMSYEHTTTGWMGQLLPLYYQEVIPGDVWICDVEAIIRANPILAPLLHLVKISIHFYECPIRLVWPKIDESGNNFESLITGGEKGDLEPSIPYWGEEDIGASNNFTMGSLADYLGMPLVQDPGPGFVGILPNDFLRRTYNLIINEHYRDQNLEDPVPLTNQEIRYRAWWKNRFTTAVPTPQKGIAPIIPIAGEVPIQQGPSGNNNPNRISVKASVENSAELGTYPLEGAYIREIEGDFMPYTGFVDLYASTAQAFSANAEELRVLMGIQNILTLAMSGGSRYSEYLKAQYGSGPSDYELYRPRYIGGTSSTLQISEVLKTSEGQGDPVPQGNLAGHGLGLIGSHIGKAKIREHGFIMGIVSIMPNPTYSSQGFHPSMMMGSRFDYYNPAFASVGFQPIFTRELYATPTSTAPNPDNTEIFGYQQAWDWMRSRENIVSNEMRGILNDGSPGGRLNHWHLAQDFEGKPILNKIFVTMDGKTGGSDNQFMRPFAVQDEPPFIIYMGYTCKMLRGMPVFSDPGLIDHVYGRN